MPIKKCYYKLRAETQYDIYEFIKVAGNKISEIDVTDRVMGPGFPDRDMTFKSKLDLDGLRALLGKVGDSHVMIESLNLVELYDGKRWYQK